MSRSLSKVRQAGFTLVEVLVVLGILALAVTVSLPFARQSNQKQSVSQFTLQVKSMLRYARNQAVANGTETVVVFDRVERTFSLRQSSEAVTVPDAIAVEFLTARNEATETDLGFRFFPDGTSTGGSIFFEDGVARTGLSINWLTGHVSKLQDS